jgi:hypothetical protein
MSGRPTTTAAARFAEKCSAPTADGCIEWTAARTKNGYGVFHAGERMHLAHRWAYEQTHGKPADGLDVCHHCDNRRCVNVAHLFAGTRADNMRDAMRKGRISRVTRHAGEAHPMAKLNDEKVRAMRRLADDGADAAKVARAFDTSYMAAYRVINRFTWNHI